MHLKSKGYQAEQLVAEHYRSRGRTLLAHNRTIPGGELDLILEQWGELRFLEVKCVDATPEWEDYISPKKLTALQRSIDAYLQNRADTPDYSLDIAFVQGETILQIYENVTNT